MSSKVQVDSQSPFRKSHTASRSSGSKTQREGSSSHQGNQVNFFGHNLQQAINSCTIDQGGLNINHSYAQQLQQQASTYQQQLQGVRNNSENRHSITSINSSSINNNNISSAMNALQSSNKTNSTLRNNTNFSATPQKKKDGIPMYIIESGSSNTNHSTSLNNNYNQIANQNSQLTSSAQLMKGNSGTTSSGVKPQQSQSGMKIQQSTSLSSSSQKFQNSNSIFTNNFSKENVGLSMQKNNIQQKLVDQNKILCCREGNTSGNQQSIGGYNDTINNSSKINQNLTNSRSNQNGFNQMKNQNNNNNNSTSLSPNQNTIYQNALNSSWKMNTMQNETPKKNGESNSNNTSSSALIMTSNNNYNQNNSSNSMNKLLSSTSRCYSKRATGQQPYFQENNYKVMMNTIEKRNEQNQSPLNSSSTHGNNRLNTSTSSSSKVHQNDEIKRLKMEIEQFKNREIKYLVRIATLEKEAKRLSEQLDKSESINRDISQENSKIRRMNSFNNNNNSFNLSYQGNSTDKNMLLANISAQNNINLTSNSIDEFQRSIRQKTEPQDSTLQNNNSQNNPLNSGICCQCGLNSFSNSYGINSGNKQGASTLSSSNSASYNKYKSKYVQLRNQHKEILRHYIDVEKENKEIKSESQVMRQLYIEKVCTKNQQQEMNSNQDSNIYQNSSNHSISALSQSIDNNQQDKIPSFLKVLSIGQLCN